MTRIMALCACSLVCALAGAQAPSDFQLVGLVPNLPGGVRVRDLATGTEIQLDHLPASVCATGTLSLAGLDLRDERNLFFYCVTVHPGFQVGTELIVARYDGPRLQSTTIHDLFQATGEFAGFRFTQRGNDLVLLAAGNNGMGSAAIPRGIYLVSPFPGGTPRLVVQGLWNQPAQALGNELAALNSVQPTIDFIDLTTGSVRVLNRWDGLLPWVNTPVDLIVLDAGRVLVAYAEGYVALITASTRRILFSPPGGSAFAISRQIIGMEYSRRYGLLLHGNSGWIYRGNPANGNLEPFVRTPFHLRWGDPFLLYRAPTPVNWVFGTGCPGGPLGLVPDIVASGPPALGSPGFAIEVQVAPSNVPAWLVLGFSRTEAGGRPLPLDLTPLGFSGCTVYVRPDASVVTMTDGAGRARVPLPIPADPSLLHQQLHSQWLLFDRSVPLAMTPPLLSEMK